MLGYAQVAVSAKFGFRWKEVFTFLGLLSFASAFIISLIPTKYIDLDLVAKDKKDYLQKNSIEE